MAYIEINNSSREGDLWKAYKRVTSTENFSMRRINEVTQIWPVFQGLFRKQKELSESHR
jgi:uncharacterized sporulation protein YeaH/YhbH (DUF444 family)